MSISTLRSGKQFRDNNYDKHNMCPICLENMNKPKETITTNCGHKFHTSCLGKCTNTDSCPMCRQYLNIQQVFCKIRYETINNPCKYLNKFIPSNIEHVNTNLLKQLNIKDAYEQLINQNPKYFLQHNFKYYYPIYVLKTKERKIIYISHIFRQTILWQPDNVKDSNIIVRWSPENKPIYCVDNYNSEISFKKFNILYEWIYDVFMSLKRHIFINYHRKINTLVLDFISIIINKFDVSLNHLQTAVSVAIYQSIYIFDKIYVSKELIRDYSLNSIEMELFNKYSEYLDEFIEHNIKII